MGDVLLLLGQVAALPLCSTSMLLILCNNIHLIAAFLHFVHLTLGSRYNIFHMLCTHQVCILCERQLAGGGVPLCSPTMFLLLLPFCAQLHNGRLHPHVAQVPATGAHNMTPATTSAYQFPILSTAAFIFCYIYGMVLW